MAIALVGVNYGVLSVYDVLAVRYIRHSLPLQKTALVGFISYAISNSIGFALLSGGIYYFLPLAIATVILGVYELQRRWKLKGIS